MDKLDKPDLLLERALLDVDGIHEQRRQRNNASLRSTIRDVGRHIMGRRRSERRRWLELVRRCSHL